MFEILTVGAIIIGLIIYEVYLTISLTDSSEERFYSVTFVALLVMILAWSYVLINLFKR